ncbi:MULTISPECIES: DUF6850 family outer membrane beta-barrel protein [unclassified Flavobacterium]|uniref:DUF6850 family outer membrane beta-barrel protein n=1 Tax=unclassified Flavobacterium TaxID=196869 RepID=UPI000968A117|nr:MULTISPECIES: DUF6850 family outer membrane beta-barrel protein [unclassified Flavobacterium]MBN9285436.1 hypothetical protein [Flavobacterium sp.]OJV71428.1 MAG: hypothetical protein BGO42_06120 [Flavobacterium sp. 40-81]
MTSKKVIFYFILLVSCAANAQLTDSLSVQQNLFYNDVQQHFWKNPLFYTTQHLNDFTLTQIDFSQKNLNLKRVQTADRTTQYSFSTQGIYNVKPRLRLFGGFTFNKIAEKGLGYNFSTQRTENQNVLSPNYFFAPKKGDWDIQNYNLDGGFAYQFDSNILLGAKAFYKNGKSYRTIDPRPEIQQSNYGGELQTGYNFNNNSLFVSAGIAKKTETSNITYVNDAQNAPAYPETFTRFASGYGRIIFNSSYNRYIFNTIDKNFGFGYQYQNSRNKVSATYKYNKSLESFYRKNARGYVYIDDELKMYMYRVIAHTGELNYFYDGEKVDYKAAFGYERQKGDNFSVIENGQNYRMNLDIFTFSNGVIKKDKDRVVYAFELGANYIKHKYIDLLGNTDKLLNTLEIQTSFNKDILAKEKNKINLSVGVKYYMALDEKLVFIPISSSNTSFADNVIRPDQAFDATSKLQSNIMAQYFYSLSKTKKLRIFANYNTLVALGDQYKTYTTDFNTTESSYFNGGISIIY